MRLEDDYSSSLCTGDFLNSIKSNATFFFRFVQNSWASEILNVKKYSIFNSKQSYHDDILSQFQVSADISNVESPSDLL